MELGTAVGGNGSTQSKCQSLAFQKISLPNFFIGYFHFKKPPFLLVEK